MYILTVKIFGFCSECRFYVNSALEQIMKMLGVTCLSVTWIQLFCRLRGDLHLQVICQVTSCLSGIDNFYYCCLEWKLINEPAQAAKVFQESLLREHTSGKPLLLFLVSKNVKSIPLKYLLWYCQPLCYQYFISGNVAVPVLANFFFEGGGKFSNWYVLIFSLNMKNLHQNRRTQFQILPCPGISRQSPEQIEDGYIANFYCMQWVPAG